jgi:hypothetical protein
MPVKLNFRVPDDFFLRLKAASEKSGLSYSEFLRVAAEEKMGVRTPTDPTPVRTIKRVRTKKEIPDVRTEPPPNSISVSEYQEIVRTSNSPAERIEAMRKIAAQKLKDEAARKAALPSFMR